MTFPPPPERAESHHVGPAELAVSILQNATQFNAASVGYAGVIPDEVMAWRVIAFRPDAERTFLELLNTATPAGQLYALAGLRFLDRQLFAQKAERFKNRPDHVQILSGCILSSARIDELVGQISRGDWVWDFVTVSN